MGAEIVIVEDDPAAGSLLTELLEHSGFTTDLVQDGSQALSVVKSNRPRLVILDIMLPGLDGLGVCKAIKRDLALRGTKVIILSGKVFAVERERVSRAGADLFIPKPFDVQGLSRKVVDLIGPPAKPS